MKIVVIKTPKVLSGMFRLKIYNNPLIANYVSNTVPTKVRISI